MKPILSKDTHYFPFHQMFGGFSRHFRHVSISKNAYLFIIYNWVPCGWAVLHEVRPYSGGGLRNISISIFLPLSNKRLPF